MLSLSNEEVHLIDLEEIKLLDTKYFQKFL